MARTENTAAPPNASGALRMRAVNLREEFQGFAMASRPPENPVHDYDLNLSHGAQLMAARLGYRIFPATPESMEERLRTTACPEPSHALITKWWSGENRSCPIMAALGPSNVTVVEIENSKDTAGFESLARWEDLFGPLPRTRIVRTPTGFQIHMRGSTSAPHESLGNGLRLLSVYRGVFLPGTNLGERGLYRWLRVDALRDAPNWVLGRRIKAPRGERASQ